MDALRRLKAAFALFLLAPGLAAAQANFGPKVNGADTVWMVVATVLVLFMTPGLAMFYGGMVRRKNVLSTMLDSFVAMGVVSVVWLLLTYSLAFGHTTNGFVGSLEYLWGQGISMKDPYPYAPHTFPAGVFMLYQMMFAIITPALISGAIAERMKFGAYVLFLVLWAVFVYAPIACWVWNPGGWLSQKGVLDFAGGTVVHLSSGVSALVACIVLGRRSARRLGEEILPNNLTLTLIGAGLLWFGWIGFNAGSALAMNPISVNAFASTHIAAACGMLAWLICEKVSYGKATALGAASGLVAGLVAITPAAGFVTPVSGIFIGLIAGVVCCLAIRLKNRFKYDDALDVVGVHGIGGAAGAILTGVFATALVNPAVADTLKSNGGQMGLILAQIIGVVAVAVYAFIVSFILLKICQLFGGIRAAQHDEDEGLDVTLHGEAGYNL